MRRRGVGIAAVKNKGITGNKFKSKGSELAEDQLSQMSKQLESFQNNLQEFASKHKNDIRRNAEFRQHFQQMCATIGVDPLASSKGFWSEMLGVGDYYYELGVQIAEVGMATSHRNGGIMNLEELRKRVMKSRGSRSGDVSKDDILQAIKRLRILGSGFTLIPIPGGGHIVQSVPGELTLDHTIVLQQAEETGYLKKSQLVNKLGWDPHRADIAMEQLVKESMAWVDTQSAETQYWFPGLFNTRADIAKS
ncbi:vacuolar-sorting protein SNF8-like [Watersipora subatra]|uniref:vacuolar-sorting protein SNF8-like n=1 Tax=Watersipora subatra TaxID=2589382 RepID=UPI00355C1FE5